MMLYGLLVSISYVCIYKRHIITIKLSGLITSLLHVKMSLKVCTLGYIVMHVNQLTNIGTTLSVSLAEVICVTICDGCLCIDLCHSSHKSILISIFILSFISFFIIFTILQRSLLEMKESIERHRKSLKKRQSGKIL